MATQLATDLVFPNIKIYRKFNENGNLTGYNVVPDEGYVIYDTNDHFTELDPETMEERPVIYYRTGASLPFNYNFDNFSYEAVLRSEVDENYIFGGGDNNHEVM